MLLPHGELSGSRPHVCAALGADLWLLLLLLPTGSTAHAGEVSTDSSGHSACEVCKILAHLTQEVQALVQHEASVIGMTVMYVLTAMPVASMQLLI
jgi:hypothetical protein